MQSSILQKLSQFICAQQVIKCRVESESNVLHQIGPGFRLNGKFKRIADGNPIATAASEGLPFHTTIDPDDRSRQWYFSSLAIVALWRAEQSLGSTSFPLV